jgi:hypothetical protein
MRLATNYVPPDKTFILQTSAGLGDDMPTPGPMPPFGTIEFYVHMLGGQTALAHLYLQVGLLHLDGMAPSLLSSSPSALSVSALRLPVSTQASALLHGSSMHTPAWHVARANARTYFDCARQLAPALDVPRIADESLDAPAGLVMPAPDVSTSDSEDETVLQPRPRQRRRAGTVGKTVVTEVLNPKTEQQTPPRVLARREPDDGGGWVQYAPAVLGAGTALVAIAVVSVLSFTWRMQKARD